MRLGPSLLSLTVAVVASAVTPRRSSDVAPAQVLEDVRRLAPMAGSVAGVHGLVLRRDAELRMDEGTLQLLTPVGGRTIAAVFVGSGSLTLTPPLEVERHEIRRVLGDSIRARPITAAMLVFGDRPSRN